MFFPIFHILFLKLHSSNEIQKPEIIIEPTLLIGDGEIISLNRIDIIQKDSEAIELVIDFKNEKTLSNFLNSNGGLEFGFNIFSITRDKNLFFGMKDLIVFDTNRKEEPFQKVIRFLFFDLMGFNFYNLISMNKNKNLVWFFCLNLKKNDLTREKIVTKKFQFDNSSNPPKLKLYEEPWYQSWIISVIIFLLFLLIWIISLIKRKKEIIEETE